MKRAGRWLILIILVLAVLTSVTALWVYRLLSHNPPALGSTAGELVFMSNRDGDWDIYRLDSSGELHNLTAESPAHEYFPSFTFDGEQLSLFSATREGVTPAAVHVDGTGFETRNLLDAMLTVLAEGQTDWNPVWNPGANRIAWARVLPGLPPHLDLFVADANGDHRVQLTSDTALDGMHSWSPDGSRLVYVSDAGGRFNNTYTVNIADGTITRLTAHEVNDYAPFWSVDGRQILVIFSFSKAMRDGVLEMYVMNADGNGLRPLGADEVFTGGQTYAPDGKTVAYVSNESGTWQIYLMDADGTHVRQLIHGNSNSLYPVWRPVPTGQ